jgi:hypothetical protein
MVEGQQLFGRTKKVDVIALIFGAVILLIYGSMALMMHLYGDLGLTKGEIDGRLLGDISVIMHASVGIALLLSPLRRRFFRLLATALALICIGLSSYFYLENTHLRSMILLIFGLLINVMLLAPSLLVLYHE